MIKILFSFILSSSFLLSSQVTDNLDIRGFGSIGISYNDNKDMLYRNDITDDSGSSADLSLSPLTNFGLQFDYSFSDRLTATVQGYWKNKESGYYSTEWANLKYSLDDGDFLRVGKMRLPLYMYSDILNVSYAYTWVHLPNEMYSSMISNYVGLEYTKNFLFDEYDLSIQLLTGESKNNPSLIFNNDFKTSFDVRNLVGITITGNYHNLKLRGSHFVGKIDTEQDTVKGIAQDIFQDPLYFPDSGAYLNDKYIINDDTVKFSGIGFEYDNDFILSSEYTQLSIENNIYLEKIKAWYFNAGYRFGKFQPFVIYAKNNKSQGSIEENFTNPSEQDLFYTDGSISPTTPSLYNIFNGYVDKINFAQKSLSLGAKYNLNQNIVLKAQIEKIYIDEDYDSTHLNLSNTTNTDMNVYHISVNFTF